MCSRLPRLPGPPPPTYLCCSWQQTHKVSTWTSRALVAARSAPNWLSPHFSRQSIAENFYTHTSNLMIIFAEWPGFCSQQQTNLSLEAYHILRSDAMYNGRQVPEPPSPSKAKLASSKKLVGYIYDSTWKHSITEYPSNSVSFFSPPPPPMA
jgi:hypothetical protein